MSGYNPVSPFGSVFEGLLKGAASREEADRQKQQMDLQQRIADAQIANMAADNKYRDQQLQDNRMRDLRDASFTGQITPQQALGTWTGYGYAAPTQTKTVGTGQEMARPSQNFMGPMPEAMVQKQVAYNPFPAAGLTREQQATLAAQAATRAQDERQHRETLASQRAIADQQARLDAERIKATRYNSELDYKAAAMRSGADAHSAEKMAQRMSYIENAVSNYAQSLGANALTDQGKAEVMRFRLLAYNKAGIFKPEDFGQSQPSTASASPAPQPGPTPAPTDPDEIAFRAWLAKQRGGK